MKRYSLYAIAAVLLIALVWAGCSTTDRGPLAPNTIGVAAKPAAVATVMAVQDRHTDRLLAVRGVVGTATGLGSDGGLVIKVLTESRGVAGIPSSLDGVPVETEVTGKIVAFAATGIYPRPVPIGVSTGNEGECSAGTIGCRVKDPSGNVFALSNNHVYALENRASIGSNVHQPGRYDTGCATDPNNIIGTLAAFVPIVFTGGAKNKVDAAIALSSTGNLSNSTSPLPNGYGVPSSTPASAALNLAVKKYGRTTELTRGKVTGVNVTVKVRYSSGIARFIDQIQIGPGGFSAAGDSGSLIVTDNANANPVGLLFAGSSTTTIANRIQNVTSALGVTIDGAP